MKRGLSLLLVLQILFLNAPASEADDLYLNDYMSEPIKIACQDEFGNEIPYPKGPSLSGAQITGIAAAGTGLFTLGSIYWKRKHDYTRQYELISQIEAGESMNDIETQAYISRSAERLKLLPAIGKKLNQHDLDDVKPVALLKTNNEKLINESEWFFLLEDSQIQDRSLHMYSLKLPSELATSSGKITINSFLVADMPVNAELNNNIDFHMFKKPGANKIAKAFVTGKFDHFGKFKGKSNKENLNPSSDNNKKLVVIEKEFKLNKLNSDKPIVLAISSLSKSKKEEQNLNQQNYAVIVRVKQN